jgi:hypothetical protein
MATVRPDGQRRLPMILNTSEDHLHFMLMIPKIFSPFAEVKVYSVLSLVTLTGATIVYPSEGANCSPNIGIRCGLLW